MATAMCGKVQSTPVDYVRIYLEMLEKMQEHVAKQRRKGTPPDLPFACRLTARIIASPVTTPRAAPVA
jgi:hypothetical protein